MAVDEFSIFIRRAIIVNGIAQPILLVSHPLDGGWVPVLILFSLAAAVLILFLWLMSLARMITLSLSVWYILAVIAELVTLPGLAILFMIGMSGH